MILTFIKNFIRQLHPQSYEITLPCDIKKYDIIFHIGAPKTGSSAIQYFLLAHREPLQLLGYYYPEHGLDQNGISGGQSILGKKLMDSDYEAAKAVLEAYIQEAKKNNCTLLISAESLFNKAELLSHMTVGYNCQIIAFYRDALESIYSNYNQGIKRSFSTVRLEAYCQNIIKNNAPFFSGEIFDTWEKYFHKENLSILTYDSKIFKHTPIQSLFLTIIGIDKTAQKRNFKFSKSSINNSYSLAALELKRMLNFILDPKKTNLNNEIDWFLQGISDQTKKNKFQLEDRLSDTTFQQLQEKFASINKKIHTRYFTNINPNFLQQAQTHNKQTIQQIQLHTDTANIIAQLSEKNPKVFSYIQRQVKIALNEPTADYELLKLAELLNYDINQIQPKSLWFNAQQLKNMPNFQLVDFYRVISSLLYHRGDLEHAQPLIEKALEIRPRRSAIIELSEKIKSALNATNEFK